MLNFADVNFRISFAFKLLAEKYYSKGAGHQRRCTFKLSLLFLEYHEI